MRHEQIDRAIAVEIRRNDRGGRLCWQWLTSREMSFAIIQADVTRSGDVAPLTGFAIDQIRIVAAVGGYYVRIAVTVEVRQGHVPCAPFGIAERAEFSEVAAAVISVNKLAIGRIVADHDVQVAVAIDIG